MIISPSPRTSCIVREILSGAAAAFTRHLWTGQRNSLPIRYLIIAGNPRIGDPTGNDQRRDYPMSLIRESLRTELVVDLVIDSGNFTARTGHVDGPLPAGGNVMHVNGNVEWRPFSKMRPQFQAGYTYYW